MFLAFVVCCLFSICVTHVAWNLLNYAFKCVPLKMSSNGQQVALEYNVAARCVAVVLKPANDQMGKSEDKVRTEHEIFTDFVDENRTCYWNPHLRESIENLRFAGYLLESLSLLLAGRDIYLNTVLDAWSRRVLRPPQGFRIHTAGEKIESRVSCLK